MAPSEIQNLNERSQFEWPAEFVDLYSKHDGVGLKMQLHEEVLWNFVPTSQIGTFTLSVREWFSETHPEIAKVFFPFFDWGCGDAVGYVLLDQILKDVVDEILPGTLFEFDHENYKFDASQPWIEFLQPSCESIRLFLE